MEETTVRFVRSKGPYNKGVEAGFPPERAQALVKSGHAVIIGTRRLGGVTRTEPHDADAGGARGRVRKN